MVTLNSIIKTGGKKYLPVTDYVAEVAIAKDKMNNGKKSILLGYKIIDTLPEGGMQDLVESLEENEKVPVDEIMWETLYFPVEGEKPKATKMKMEKIHNVLLGCGVLGEDEEGQLYQLDEMVDLSAELSAEVFLPEGQPRYIGISVKRDHDWRDKEKVKPKVDVIARYIPVPEED